MPIYEYICADCKVRFEELRKMSEADEPCECPECLGMKATRVVSVVYSKNESGGLEGSKTACASCVSSNCATCRV